MSTRRAPKRPVAKLLRSSSNPPRYAHHQAFAVSFDVSHRLTHAHQRRGPPTSGFGRFFAVQMGKKC